MTPIVAAASALCAFRQRLKLRRQKPRWTRLSTSHREALPPDIDVATDSMVVQFVLIMRPTTDRLVVHEVADLLLEVDTQRTMQVMGMVAETIRTHSRTGEAEGIHLSMVISLDSNSRIKVANIKDMVVAVTLMVKAIKARNSDPKRRRRLGSSKNEIPN